jgi:hypothetical protein
MADCKNCGTSFKGNFCPDCGQAAHSARIDLHYFVHDVPHSILHVDKGFFHTLKMLAIQPGVMLKEYVDGKRVAHFKPFAFVLIMTTVCTILINLMQRGETVGEGVSFFSKYPSLLIFLLIPVISMVTWLCFYNRRFNYWEHILFNTYLGAFLNIFLLLQALVRFLSLRFNWQISMMIPAMILMFCFMTYYGYVFGALMHAPGKMRSNMIRISIMDGTIATIYFFSFVLTKITVTY